MYRIDVGRDNNKVGARWLFAINEGEELRVQWGVRSIKDGVKRGRVKVKGDGDGECHETLMGLSFNWAQSNFH